MSYRSDVCLIMPSADYPALVSAYTEKTTDCVEYRLLGPIRTDADGNTDYAVPDMLHEYSGKVDHIPTTVVIWTSVCFYEDEPSIAALIDAWNEVVVEPGHPHVFVRVGEDVADIESDLADPEGWLAVYALPSVTIDVISSESHEVLPV